MILRPDRIKYKHRSIDETELASGQRKRINICRREEENDYDSVH